MFLSLGLHSATQQRQKVETEAFPKSKSLMLNDLMTRGQASQGEISQTGVLLVFFEIV